MGREPEHAPRPGGSRPSRDRRPDRASRLGRPTAPWPSGSGGAGMAERDHIRNPIEWGVDQLKTTDLAVARASHSLRHHGEAPSSLPTVRRIGVADLRDVLVKGLGDFAAYRTDVVFICVIYPLAGLVLARLGGRLHILPPRFPLASRLSLLWSVTGG